MLTNEEVEYLLKLDKSLYDPRQVIDLKEKKNRLILISPIDNDYKFWMEITSNTKINFKTSIHHLESESFVGLLRIDFKGRHQNPIEIKSTLPENLKKYAGKWFDLNEPHMHIFVEGYKPLVWAIPLSDTDFEPKEIKDVNDISDLICSFASRINLKSNLLIQQAIF